MKYKLTLRILSLLLCAALLCGLLSGCGQTAKDASAAAGSSAAVSQDSYVYPVRTTVPFSEMSTENFDEEAWNTVMTEFETAIDTNNSLDTLKADWDRIVDLYDNACTDTSISYVLYFLDVENEDIYNKYAELESRNTELSDRLLTALHRLFGSQYADEMTVYIHSDDLLEDAVDYVPMTEEEFRLSDEKTALTDRYFDLVDSPDAAEECAELYLQLLDNLIAKANFNDAYPDYATQAYYEKFFRDYAPEDTEILWNWVKEFVVPQKEALSNFMYSRSDLLSFYVQDVEYTEILDLLQPYVSSVSPEAADAFSSIRTYDLINIEPSEKKNDGGFTITFPAYGTPFIYNNPSGYAQDIETVIHEFGHFLSAYVTMCPEVYAYSCYDTCEVNSQGMEMLMTKYAGEIYGEEHADTAKAYLINNLLSGIVDGCIFDEFQQKAFRLRAEGKLNTAKEVEDLYLAVESEYGSGGWGSQWYQVAHTFESPFYYISYATSATAALGLLVRSMEDYDGAVALYNELIELGNGLGFCATMEQLGLPNPLTEKGIEELTSGLSEYFDSLEHTNTSSSQSSVSSSAACGQHNEDTYLNLTGGFSATFPKDDWYIYSASEIAEVYGYSKEVLEKESGRTNLLESGETLIDFMVAERTTSNNVSVSITQLPGLAAILDEETIMTASLQEVINSLSTVYEITDYSTDTSDFAGAVHPVLRMTMSYYGINIYESQVYLKADGYLFIITATSFYDDTTEDILSIFTPLV